MSENEIINSIALQQATIEDLKKIREEVSSSATENIQIKIETKHWYGYSKPFLMKEKHKLTISRYTMKQILDEGIKTALGRIDKLIEMEIERRNNESND